MPAAERIEPVTRLTFSRKKPRKTGRPTYFFAESGERDRRPQAGGIYPRRVSLGRREPELRGLIRARERGELRPVDVRLGELPANASPAMRRVAADIGFLLGLRLAVDEDRPLPYSTRFCAERCGLRHHTQASRVLRALVEAGVIRCVESLEPRGKGDGTKLYQAPDS